MLKILGGKFGGRTLKTVRTDKTRPTTSLVRKALFDILQSHIDGATFLDLFAGSGAIGIEALSRGAKACTFIDVQKEAIRCIEANVKQLGMTSYTLMQTDVLVALDKLSTSFDIIYADPPYHHHVLYHQLIRKLDEGSILKVGGLLFIEAQTPSPLEGVELRNLQARKPRKYGDSLLCEYVRI